MNILFISDNKILGYGGGSIENRKYYYIVKKYAEQHGDDFRIISPDNNLEDSLVVKIRKNRFTDILIRLKGHSSFLYDVWKKNYTLIKDYKPDIIVLGRSRFGFIAKDAKTSFDNCTVVTNVDNVEQDFVEFCFTEKKGIFNGLKYRLEKKCVKSDEENVIKYSDRLIFLTKRNYERYKEIYNYQADSCEVLPMIKKIKTKIKIEILLLLYLFQYVPVAKFVQNIISNTFLDNYYYLSYYLGSRVEYRFFDNKIGIVTTVYLILYCFIIWKREKNLGNNLISLNVYDDDLSAFSFVYFVLLMAFSQFGYATRIAYYFSIFTLAYLSNNILIFIKSSDRKYARLIFNFVLLLLFLYSVYSFCDSEGNRVLIPYKMNYNLFN